MRKFFIRFLMGKNPISNDIHHVQILFYVSHAQQFYKERFYSGTQIFNIFLNARLL